MAKREKNHHRNSRKRIKILQQTRETDEARKTALGQLDTPFTINLNVRLNALTRS